MRSIQLRPKYTIILKYDILPGVQERYFRFVMGEFIPAMQEMGYYMHRAWHILWGDYPERHIEFITENENIAEFMDSTRWLELESKLQDYTTNYTRRVQHFTGNFQV
jgi:hypothetical protein